ncbi:polyphosphate polymerase domain-containing protein [Paracoccus sp. (in: a-proteobacteria)]|uniref:polyphosphate polymerase domain-containing protein n=1 Tax=Paracoccus sp. TaxID=267 RepID=UPI0032204FFA
MDPRIAASLGQFDGISLEALNAKAAMLERLDQKYIIPAAGLHLALAEFRALFDVLEIDGRRAFTYATRYFDDAERRAYYDHHQGRRKRCKVRVRQYLDAGFSYLEVKLKDKRDVTVKKRLRLDAPLEELDAACTGFIDRCHTELYGTPLARDLTPVIGMRYQRVTLVAKQGGERMTIDSGIDFAQNGHKRAVSPGLFIVETKSARGNGAADAILRRLHLHPTKRCSKYCIGMAALGQVARMNRFLPALRRLSLLGAAPLAAASASRIAA